jgi:hypothetical protein
VNLSPDMAALLLPCRHGIGQRLPQRLLQTEVVHAAGEDLTENIKQSLIGSPERLQTPAYGKTQLPYMGFPGIQRHH